MAQQFHIDHVTVAGKDVKAMTEALRSVAGITARIWRTAFQSRDRDGAG